MAHKVIGYVLLFTVVSNCLLRTESTVYSVGSLDDIVTKRRYQRRSFLKSFCARRCNIGKGGNVCRCNGFHFAGKRQASSYLPEDHADSSDSERFMYSILADNDKVILEPSRAEVEKDKLPTDTRLRTEIENALGLPELISENLNDRTYASALSQLMRKYAASIAAENNGDERI